MYNRYIPQDDGSYSRNRMPEPSQPRSQRTPSPPPPPIQNNDLYQSHEAEEKKYPHILKPQPNGFLKQLLPKGFDTGDLIVILLLLLMAGDKPEDRNTALLTLALYCFL